MIGTTIAGKSASEIHHLEPAPTEVTRYGLYIQDREGLHRIAETDKEGIGPALVQLADDRAQAGLSPTEIIGVLDRIDRRWICGLWPGGGRRPSAIQSG